MNEQADEEGIITINLLVAIKVPFFLELEFPVSILLRTVFVIIIFWQLQLLDPSKICY